MQIMLITSMQVLASIRWVDEADGKGPIDPFFDRVVIMALKLKNKNNIKIHPTLTKKGFKWNNTALSTGVFITKKHVLVSFNAFSHYTIDKSEKFIGMVLHNRTIVTRELHTYDIVNITFDCIHDWQTEKDDNQMHGIEKLHSPTHDLRILRTTNNLDFIEPEKPVSFSDYKVNVATRAGPIVTRYAKKGDELGRDVKFASVAFRNKRHMNESQKLRSRAYEEDENVVEDCEEWMPRYWGYFICIKNVDNYKGVGSGAILIYNNTLFGIGSFLMRRGNDSILVFTDVRPYSHTFSEACPLPATTTAKPDNPKLKATRNNRDNDAEEEYFLGRDYL